MAISSSSFPSINYLSILKSNPHSTIRTSNGLPMVTCSILHDDSALHQAAKHTVDSYVKNGMVIGLGSGRASSLAIHYLGRQLRSGIIRDILGIPTSVGSASEAAKAGIPLDQYRDGVNVAGKLVFIATGRQYKGVVDGSIPVLIRSINWLDTAEAIDDLFLGDAEVWRRPSIGYAGPLGGDFPLVTKEGHNVLDVIFTSPILSLAEVADSLDQVDGVVEHGVISRILCTAVIASENGLSIVDNTFKFDGSRI